MTDNARGGRWAEALPLDEIYLGDCKELLSRVRYADP